MALFNRLLLASNNQAKLLELKNTVSELDVEILTPKDLGIELEVLEDAKTYRGNALKKATQFAALAQIPTLADDSGLEIDLLGGFPGVKSARWMAGSDQERVLGILKKIEKNTNLDDRSAKFVCCLCLFLPKIDQKPSQKAFFFGECEGKISDKPIGEFGFAYDKIFIPKGFKHTFAQLGDLKTQISHRAKAFVKLKTYLEQSI